jgi:hypothetical protein
MDQCKTCTTSPAHMAHYALSTGSHSRADLPMIYNTFGAGEEAGIDLPMEDFEKARGDLIDALHRANR